MAGISASESQATFLELHQRVASGETITVNSKNGLPHLLLVPDAECEGAIEVGADLFKNNMAQFKSLLDVGATLRIRKSRSNNGLHYILVKRHPECHSIIDSFTSQWLETLRT
jgi:antitoxin (DNA-binding transcriptional repressor) of toxin-antitoxin stability system